MIRGRALFSCGHPMSAALSREAGFRRLSVQSMDTKGIESAKTSRTGSGVSVVWFRNDLRVADNEALLRAWRSSNAVLPVYVLDPRVFGETHLFKFPKTGELRAQFILESLEDLRRNLQDRSLDLIIRLGKPEDIVPNLANAVGAHTVFAHKETTSEETTVEKHLRTNLANLAVISNEDEKQAGSESTSAAAGKSTPKRPPAPKLEFVWGGTLYHIDDLPFAATQVPDIYTQFRKAVESSSQVRPACQMPSQLGPLPETMDKIGVSGPIPSLSDVGLTFRGQDTLGVMKFIGGETAAMDRLKDYFWESDKVRVYKQTRNGMLGADYSTKFSPWLAHGCITPRIIHDELKKYESERVANQSTYWVLFELIWRDYFRFLSIKYGNAIFHLGGPREVKGKQWRQDKLLFEAWRDGKTGYPLIDANMQELYKTGFMSNRGRQIVCSFMTRDMGLDWRLGGEWFETCLVDYDPCSNYGNWTYGAGVGNDPREDRYFSIPKQAQNYDPDGEYVAHWLPELAGLPKADRHNPKGAYLSPIVPLRYGRFTEGSKSQPSGRGRQKTAGGRRR